jgi:starch phosphorylase
MLLERVRELVAGGTSFEEAVRQVRATSVFTTHTPVPAGHDVFAVAQVEALMGPVLEEMKGQREAVLRLGHAPHLDHNQFHMPVLAIRLSGRVNGVSSRRGVGAASTHWPGRDRSRCPSGT